MVDRAHIMVVFVSRRTATHIDEYRVMAERMDELAREQPGFVDLVSVRDADSRQGVTVAYFTDEASVRAWRDHPEHREAQRRGIIDFYEEYDVTVSTISRQYGRTARG
jgi:heme-degrading monooxygenase HmoA